MVQLAHGRAGSPDGSGRAWHHRLGLARGSRTSASQTAAVVSDEQIRALVAGAESLSRRHRSRYVEDSTQDEEERLLRLDWAARAGRLALAERAAQALTPPGALAAGPGLTRPRR